MGLSVRRLHVSDLPPLERAEAARHQRLSGRPGASAEFHRLVEEALSSEPEGLMIADLDGEVAGVAIARQRGAHPVTGRKLGRIEHLAVATGFEHHGVSARLLREAEAYLRSRGCRTLSLRLPCDDAADAALLKDSGYQVVAWELEKALR